MAAASRELAYDRKIVAVKMSRGDWQDLANFVQGDLANMPEDDEVKIQMKRIIATINQASA